MTQANHFVLISIPQNNLDLNLNASTGRGSASIFHSVYAKGICLWADQRNCSALVTRNKGWIIT